MGTDIEYIASKLSREDILCQLAEEAAELAQAALKLHRVITGTNPTPISYDKAYDSLIEEIADVKTAVMAFTLGDADDDIAMIAKEKSARWAGRLKNATSTNRELVTPTDTPTVGVRTRQEKFLELFPCAAMRRGVLDICPMKTERRYNGCNESRSCYSCQKEYWLATAKEGKS